MLLYAILPVVLLVMSRAAAQEIDSHCWYVATLANGERIQLEYHRFGRDVQSECIHERGALWCIYYGSIDSNGYLNATERCAVQDRPGWRPDGKIHGKLLDSGRRIVGEWSDTAGHGSVKFEALRSATFTWWVDSSSPNVRLKGEMITFHLPSRGFNNELNRYLKSYLDGRAARIVREADDYHRHRTATPAGSIEQWQSATSFDVQWLSSDLVSLFAQHQRLNDSNDWGYEAEGMTFQSVDDHLRVVALKDLFVPGSDYESRIRPYIFDDARERLVMEMRGYRLVEESDSTVEAMFRAADSVLLDVDYDPAIRNFTIAQTGLRFACLPMTHPGLTDRAYVPYSALADIIDPAGPLKRVLPPVRPTSR